MQFTNYYKWDNKPMWEKRYKLSKIIRFGECKRRSNLICDFEGNFNLMCANPRAMRLLSFLKRDKRHC